MRGLGILAGCAALVGLSGCPAQLEDAGQFPEFNTNAGECYERVLASACTGRGCHEQASADNPYPPAGGLDLLSPGVAERLRDVPAPFIGVGDPQNCPTGAKYIDTQNPEQSWLLHKLDGSGCGFEMPPVPKSFDRQCLLDFINGVGAVDGGTSGNAP